MSITIYGASDDCIEIEGDIRDEVYAYDAAPTPIVLSDGTALTIEYTDEGVWRIVLVGSNHPERVTIVPAVGEDDPNYSDRATIDAVIEWATVGDRTLRS